MKKRANIATLLAVIALFLILNRAAYKGFFQDDELDNIVTTRELTPQDWLGYLASPRFSATNFRPVGHAYFRWTDRLFGLDFPKYVFPIQALHIANACLLWLLLRRLKIGAFAAVAGAAFFLLNVAAMDVYWKPMYVFDLLCTAFCLGSLLLYASGHWQMALLTMWFAYKSKELAIMLPFALAAYEIWFGEKRWKRLIPFFAISMLFGMQAVMQRPDPGNPYRIVFATASLWQTLPFYSSRLLFAPFVGLVFVLIPLFVRDRRVRLGGTILVLFFLPLLFLPGRIYSAYTYLPLTGAAIEVGALAGLLPAPAVLVFFAIWIPWNIVQLRLNRRANLTADDAARSYVTTLMDFARAHPNPPIFVLLASPAGFQEWGIRAALRYQYSDASKTPRIVNEKTAKTIPLGPELAFINFDQERVETHILLENPTAPKAPYVTMNAETPIWQLGEGWFGSEGAFRWIGRRATATIGWPAGAKAFGLVANVNSAILGVRGHVDVRVLLNGKEIGVKRFNEPGVLAARWDLPPRVGSEAQVEILVDTAGRIPPDPRLLGIAIVSFGMSTQ